MPNFIDPPEPRFTHTHRCQEPSCDARVRCGASPCHCGCGNCAIYDVTEFLCEDHHDAPRCDYCGLRDGAPLIDFDGDRMHPACVTEMEARK